VQIYCFFLADYTDITDFSILSRFHSTYCPLRRAVDFADYFSKISVNSAISARKVLSLQKLSIMKKLLLTIVAATLIFSSCCKKENTNVTMNTTMEDLLTRRSVRSYTDEVPPMEVIEEICKAGTYAPTGMNKQAPIIIAVTNKEVRDKLSKLNAAVFGPDNDMDPFYGAPVVLVVLADTTVAYTWKEDGSLVMGNLLNAAHAKGLGSCWIHRAKEVFETEEGKSILRDLGIDDTKYVGVGNCILGYVKGDYPTARPRKDNYVYWIK
jgi:nitroreductase